MVEITYVEHSGKSHVVTVAPGLTLMEGAIRNNVPGIVAECGGACACATCHVYIPEDWRCLTPVKSEIEDSMLEFACDADKNSRLACQITVSDSLDGLIVNIPERQG